VTSEPSCAFSLGHGSLVPQLVVSSLQATSTPVQVLLRT